MEKERIWLRPAIALAIALWLIWALQMQIARWFGRSWDIGNAGSWGDTFGALNAAFAAAASLGVLWTLGLQRHQLDLQRKDIERQQAQIADAANFQRLQRFESSFYELLHLLRDERSELKFRYSREYASAKELSISAKRDIHEGKMALRAAALEITFWIKGAYPVTPPDPHQVTKVYRTRVHVRYESSLGPYFRLIYTILRRIHEEPSLTEADKIQYGNLLRSQLTTYEAFLIAVNGLAEFSGNLRFYVEEYRLLKYTRSSQRRILSRSYPSQASEGRD